MVDTVRQGLTREFRDYCSFYTESDPILEYMVSRLGNLEKQRILEPCAGDGAFIGKILDKNLTEEFELIAYDLNPISIQNLKQRFDTDDRITVIAGDTLLDKSLDSNSERQVCFSRIIGNPPYGAWQEPAKRIELKRKYGGYVKESYSLFIRRCLSVLEENGRLVFIVPDTFLALNMHQEMRREILSQYTVEELLLIPSNFFPGVNFGYSNLCIITISATEPAKNVIDVLSLTSTVDALYSLAKNDFSVADSHKKINQAEILNNIGSSFFVNSDSDTLNILKASTVNIGDLSDCVTGFYSGDNASRIYTGGEFTSEELMQVSPLDVDFHPHRQEGILSGCRSKAFIPIYMGGNAVVDKKLTKFIRWTEQDVSEYKADKRTRFQNSTYYFTPGVGVPMVKSKKLKAFYLDRQLFDQSVVGIFPKNELHLNLLLVYLNSMTCTKIINSINHTANNSANYIKRIPVPINESLIALSEEAVARYRKNEDLEEFLESADRIFNISPKMFEDSGEFLGETLQFGKN